MSEWYFFVLLFSHHLKNKLFSWNTKLYIFHTKEKKAKSDVDIWTINHFLSWVLRMMYYIYFLRKKLYRIWWVQGGLYPTASRKLKTTGQPPHELERESFSSWLSGEPSRLADTLTAALWETLKQRSQLNYAQCLTHEAVIL